MLNGRHFMKTTHFTTQTHYQTRKKAQSILLVELSGGAPWREIMPGKAHKSIEAIDNVLISLSSLSQVEIIGVSFVKTHQHKQLECFQVFKILTKLT